MTLERQEVEVGNCYEISAKEPVNCIFSCFACLLLEDGSHGCSLGSINGVKVLPRSFIASAYNSLSPFCKAVVYQEKKSLPQILWVVSQ